MQGHIHKRVRATKDGRQTTSWYVVIDLDRARRRQKWHGGFRTRKEAEVARAKLANEVHSGLYVEPSKVTLQEWVESSWLPTMRSQVKPSTWNSYMRNLRLHVLPSLGQRTLQQLTPLALNALYAELMASGKQTRAGGGLAPKTVRYVHATTLHKVLADAVDSGLLQTYPADRARPPKPRVSNRREMQVWDAEQLAQFLNHVEGHRLQAAFHLAAMTGKRRGEVLGLRWHDIDLSTGRIAIRHTLVSVPYKLQDSTPKTHKARVVDLDPGTSTNFVITDPAKPQSKGAGATGITRATSCFAVKTARRSTRTPSPRPSMPRCAAQHSPASDSTTCGTPTPPSHGEQASP